MRRTCAVLLLSWLPLLAGGCRKDCTGERPGFLLNVTLPAGVDGSRVGCLNVTLDATSTHPVTVAGKLADGRTSVAFINVAGAAFTMTVAVAACEGQCPCAQPLATAQQIFSGGNDACNTFELPLHAEPGDGPRPGDGRLDVKWDLKRDLKKPDARRDGPRPDLPTVNDMAGYLPEEIAAAKWLLGKNLFTAGACPAGSFCPKASLTRRELARVVMGWRCGAPPVLGSPCCQNPTPAFPDVPATYDKSYYAFIQCAKDSSAMRGDTSGFFNPEQAAYRAHGAEAVAGAKYGPTSTCSTSFTDLETWQCPPVTKLEQTQIVKATDPGCSCGPQCFCPYAPLVRVSLALWLFRADKAP